MARRMAKRPAKKLEDQIAELEAVVSSLHTCSRGGKPIEPDQAKCPHCGAIIGEDVEFPTEAPTLRPEPPVAAAPRTGAPPSPEPVPPPPPPKPARPPAAPAPPPAVALEAPAPAKAEPEPSPAPEPESPEESREPEVAEAPEPAPAE